MKLCFVLYGPTRLAHVVLHRLTHQFAAHEAQFFLSLTRGEATTDESRLINPGVQRLLLSHDHGQSLLTRILPMISAAFDAFFIVRTDVVFSEDDTFLDALLNDVMYVSPACSEWQEADPPAVIASRSYLRIKELSVRVNAVDWQLLPTSVRVLSSTRRVVAVAGNSGAGKTTLCAALTETLLDGERVDVIETDGYHKWERGDERYGAVTHLDPYANNLSQLASDMVRTQLGDTIQIPHYDHVTGRITPGRSMSYAPVVVFCGLHTVLAARSAGATDVTIFVDTDRVLAQRWKMERDTKKRGHLPSRVAETMRRRECDYLMHVDTQKANADMVVRFQETFDKAMECSIVVQNKDMVRTLLRHGKPFAETVEVVGEEMILHMSTSDAVASVTADIVRHVLQLSPRA